MADGRRRQYVPLDTGVAFRKFGTRLKARWGIEGLAVWMLLLAAAKREPVQGTFTYTSEPEAWTKLGATATLFTWEAFVTYCGQQKQTRKRRAGDVTHVTITGWGQWNNEWKRANEAERKSRKRGENTPDTTRTQPGHYADDSQTEVEVEVDSEDENEINQNSAIAVLATPRAALPAIDSRIEPPAAGDVPSSPFDFEALQARVANRHAADATHGKIAPLLDVLPDADENTPRVLHSIFDSLPASAVELAVAEIRAMGPRRPSAYAVGIGRRIASGRTAPPKGSGRRWLTPEDDREELRREELLRRRAEA